MSKDLVEISVVVPIYNEQENVLLLLKQIQDALAGKSYEIILVDDGSTDQTIAVLKPQLNTHTKLIELRKNYGQSLALAAGIDESVGQYVVTLDGDLQNNPKDILPMLSLLKSKNLDVVTGIRQKRKDSWAKTVPSKIANFIIRVSTGLHLKDHGCALKILKQETAKELNLYGEMHRYMNLMAHLNGAKIEQLPVQHHSRKFGKSKYGLGRTTKVISDLVLLLFRQKYMQRPIHIFGNLGAIFFGLGFLINLYLLWVKLFWQEDIGNRPLLILGVLLLVLGIQFFTSGIVLDLLMRTYYESQNKKPYKIRNIHS